MNLWAKVLEGKELSTLREPKSETMFLGRVKKAILLFCFRRHQRGTEDEEEEDERGERHEEMAKCVGLHHEQEAGPMKNHDDCGVSEIITLIP